MPHSNWDEENTSTNVNQMSQSNWDVEQVSTNLNQVATVTSQFVIIVFLLFGLKTMFFFIEAQ